MKKRHKRSIAGLMVWCMLLSVISFCVQTTGIQITWAAGLVHEVGEDAVFQREYAYSFKFTGKTKVEPFGMDDALHDKLDPNGTRNFVVQEIKSSSQKGKVGVLYTNVGEYKGKNLDLKITLLDWSRLYTTWQEMDGTSIVPNVRFHTKAIQITTGAIKSARFGFTFMEHGTDNKVDISGHITLTDLDDTQKFEFSAEGGATGVYILKGNSHLKSSGNSITSEEELLTVSDKRGWSTVLFDREFYLDFYSPVKYSDKENVKLNRGEDGYLGASTFGFTAYAMGEFEISSQLMKKVSAPGDSWEKALQSTRDKPYILKEGEKFQYQIQHEISPNHLTTYQLTDVLDECLTIEGSSAVKITDQYDNDVTGKFQITISGQTVICGARETELAKDSFTNNETYTFYLTVQVRKDADIEEHHFQKTGDGYTYQIPNKASLSWRRSDGSNQRISSEEVWVQSRLIAELSVEKRAEYEWQQGDIVDYSVLIRQTKPHSRAINLEVKDISIPDGMTLLGNASASGAANTFIEKEGANGWKLTCPRLEYGDTIVVVFQCKIIAELRGREVLNTVTASAENYLDEESRPRQANAARDIWVNTPSLTVDKRADKYEWQVGEDISYQVVVNNTVSNTIGKSIKIADDSLPQGLLLYQESISVEGVQEEISYPVGDQKTGFSWKELKNQVKLTTDNNGWTLDIAYLPANKPVVVTFKCKAEESSNGREHQNKVTVSGENAEEVQDDAKAYINTASFLIEKKADHYEWQVGEKVAYSVKVKNTKEGTIGRNVIIKDMDLPEGLTLAEEEILIEGIPEGIANYVEGEEDVPGQLDTGKYNTMEEKQVEWNLEQWEQGWNLQISDLPCNQEVTITFYCIAEREGNGKEAVNQASVEALNGSLVEDDGEIYINTALLTIDKKVINPNLEKNDNRLEREFRVGETVIYQVEVNNLQPGSIARNLEITDVSIPEGLALIEGEEALTYKGLPDVFLNPVLGTQDPDSVLNPEYYGEVEEKAIERTMTREENGWRFSVSDLPYNTPVTVQFHCQVLESINGMEIINRADASADNGEKVEATAAIWCNSPELNIVKEADKEVYKYGDIVTYTIQVSQEKTGCAARNIILEDIIDTEGVQLQKNSIVLLNSRKEKIEGDISVTGNNFSIQTESALVKDDNYSVWKSGQGEILQAMWNPLELQEETSLTVEYQAVIVDHQLAGQQVINRAIVNSEENLPKEDQETVDINAPLLSIEKTSDKAAYQVGEVGRYRLTIRQLREDVTACEVLVRDAFDKGGMFIVGDSVKIRVNGQTVEPKSIQIQENQFSIETGVDMEDSHKLEVFYQVAFDSPKLAGATLVNTARAKGSNTEEVSQDLEVTLTEGPENTPAPVSTPKPEPGKSQNPTTTPQEEAAPNPTATVKPTESFSKESISYSGTGKSSVKTGDDTSWELLLLLLAAGGLGTLTVFLEKHRRKRKVYKGLF